MARPAFCLLGVITSASSSGVSATLVLPSVFLLLTWLAGVSGQRILWVWPGVLGRLEGVVTKIFLLRDLTGELAKLRFLFTVCFVFLGDLASCFFLVLSLSLLVSKALLLLVESLICLAVRGRLRLLGLLGRMVGAGGSIKLAEAGRPTELGWTEARGGREVRR